MKLTDEEMRRLYQWQTARSRSGRAECLSEEAMTRVAAGELSQSEREVIADHLMACSDCAEEYRVLRELKPWAERVAVSAYERESAIKSVSSPPGKEAQVVPRQLGWASRARRLAGIFSAGFETNATAAAALLVVSLACVAWVISLKRENARMAARLNEQLASRDQASQSLTDARRELEAAARLAGQQQTEIAELRRSVDDLSQPQVNVPITDLEQQANRGGDGATTVTAPVGANIFTLILHVADGPSFPDYALEVIDGRGRPLMRAQSLRKSQLNTFTVALPRRLLPAGRYRLKLYGLRSGHGELVGEVVAEYQMRLNYQKE